MKKFWEKNKTWIILGIAVAIIAVSIIISGEKVALKDEASSNEKVTVTGETSLNKISADEFAAMINGDGTSILYIMSTTCYYCEEFKPILEEVSAQYELPIYFIDLDSLNNQEINKFRDSHKYLTETWTGGTPAVLIVNDGKVISENSGYVEKEVFVKFLTEAGII